MPGIDLIMRKLLSVVSFENLLWRYIFFLILFLLVVVALPAQQDSSYALPLVTIKDAPGSQTGFSQWKSDSLPQAGVLSMAERLLWEMPVALRANAPGTLATVSARGAGPSRTAVLWQGLNLQSPMNGVVDIALLPLWPQDRVEIQYGGQSAAQSTGAMGGAIQLIPGFLTDSSGVKAQIGLTAGSFHRWDAHATLGMSSKCLRSSLRASWRQADNDFPYRNTALIGAPESRQVYNAAENFDLQQYNTLKIKDKNTLETALWIQRAFREIPPTMTEAPSFSWQNDRSIRAVATWVNQPNTQTRWLHRLAWQEEYIAFNFIGDIDSSRSQTASFGSEFWTSPIKQLSIRTNITAWYQRAQADGYADSSQWFQQKRLAAFGQAEYRWQQVRLSAQLRQEWAEKQGAPFTWTLGGQWDISKRLFLKIHLSRNFKLPTFNDRFWRHLGNPDLNPETGYSSDAGMHWANKNWSAELTLFQLLLDDWILWQPGADGLFRPGNLRQVWSRGLEFSGHWNFNFFKSNWKIKGRYQFVRATNTAVYSGSTTALGKLLPYTPQHTASALLRWEKGPLSATYLHQWTGARFTNADNAGSLPLFHTGNLIFQYALSWAGQQIALNATLENCWNSAYQIIEYRPMPGRSWRFGLLWGF